MRSFGLMSLCALAFGAYAALSSAAVTASEQDEADFYNGRTVQLMIGYSAGGGYDTYGRTLARHLGKHIPGNPNVVVRNVPGAGSLVLMNQIANTLPNDGTVIGAVNSGMPFEPLFGNEQAQFDVNDVSWLGNLSLVTSVGLFRKESGINKWQDLETQAATVGATGAGSNTNTIPRVLATLFNLKMTVIAGYPGSNDVGLAMERGEVDGMGSAFLSTIKAKNPEWLAPDSDVNIIFQLGRTRHPDLPNVPLVSEMAKTDREQQVVDLLGARLIMGRPYVAPPGMDPERLATLRNAIEQTTQDRAFLEDASNQGLSIDFVDGEEMQTFFKEVYDYPKEIVELLNQAMQ
jgi:tripartite-type tricarboxylate transporter receptor subunit TctC